MLRVFVLFTLVFAGAVNGASPQTLTPAITVGGGHEQEAPQWSCANLLEETKTYKDRKGYVVGKHYKLADHNSCAELYVGVYGNAVRQGLETNEFWRYSHSSSSYVAAVTFMERAGITCNMQDGVFSLVFSKRSAGGDDYGSIELDCAAEEANTTIAIGMNEKGGRKLSITYIHHYLNPSAWHIFETNTDGAISKHTKGVGINPIYHEIVVLDSHL